MPIYLSSGPVKWMMDGLPLKHHSPRPLPASGQEAAQGIGPLQLSAFLSEESG